jgi:hypothetical protein
MHRHHALAKYGPAKEVDGQGAKATRGKQANLFFGVAKQNRHGRIN